MNDAERLSRDPTFRLIGSERIRDRGAALTSRLRTFETSLGAGPFPYGRIGLARETFVVNPLRLVACRSQ